MVNKSYLLLIDQGTTSTRSILYTSRFKIKGIKRKQITCNFAEGGIVEQDAEEIWQSVLTTAQEVISAAGISAHEIAAAAITNQRETTIVWDRKTGKPIAPAIVWQDRRGADACLKLERDGLGAMIQRKTGLPLDPYFSATKISWLLERSPQHASRKDLAFGTVDSFLLNRLTGGKIHATDASNACRTMLYDINKGVWDSDLCALFGVPMELLPEVKDNIAEFGVSDKTLFGARIPIMAMVGDQQSASIGQGGFKPGVIKATYGTGCFALLHTGQSRIDSQKGLITTLAGQLDGRRYYALEGSIFNAGTVVQWLRDELRVIDEAKQIDALAASADQDHGVVLVPAFTGLGAPYWHPRSRGAIFGLSRHSGRAELASAAVRSIGFQTEDLISAMRTDASSLEIKPSIRVDGGMAASDLIMKWVSDMTAMTVERPKDIETTALGAARLAAAGIGLCPPPDQDNFIPDIDRCFEPGLDDALRQNYYQQWTEAVRATINFADQS